MIAYTYFDAGYIDRGYQALDSFIEYHNSKLIVYALDQVCYDSVKNRYGSRIEVVSIQSFFRSKDDFFKISPYLLRDVFDRCSDCELILYFDADTKFFRDCSFLCNELNGYSFGFTTHRFTESRKKYLKYGFYNFGFNFFRKDEHTQKLIHKWIEDVEAYANNSTKLKFYSDQLYLDSYITSPLVKNLDEYRVNIGPWCCDIYKWEKLNNDYYLNSEQIIHYHFSGIKKLSNNYWTISSAGGRFGVSFTVLEFYSNYIKLLKNEKIRVGFSLKDLLIMVSNCVYRQILRVRI